MIRTAKYNLSKLFATLALSAGIFFIYTFVDTSNYLNANLQSKGFKSKNGYAIVDYKYLTKSINLKKLETLGLLTFTGAAAGFSYYLKKIRMLKHINKIF